MNDSTPLNTSRLADLVRFYETLRALENTIGSPRKLADCSGRMGWPKRGVYFFFEDGESRSDSGNGPRVVRVGTHALTAGSGTKLWARLSQHKGQARTGGGNHRGSIFRLIVGIALIKKLELTSSTWGVENSANKSVREGEISVERKVSEIREMLSRSTAPVFIASSELTQRPQTTRNRLFRRHRAKG